MNCKFVTGAFREQVIRRVFRFVSCLRDLLDSKLYKGGFISTVNKNDVCSNIKKRLDYDRIKTHKLLRKPYRYLGWPPLQVCYLQSLLRTTRCWFFSMAGVSRTSWHTQPPPPPHFCLSGKGAVLLIVAGPYQAVRWQQELRFNASLHLL
jgi:hypothetical protein